MRYDIRMRLRVIALFVFLLAGAFLFPHLSFAQTPNTSFFGPIVPQATATGGSSQCPLGLDAVITTVNNLTKFAVAFGIIVTVLVFAYAAILFIMTPFSPSNREEGKTMMLSAVIGLFFVLTAWLIVSAFMALFVGGKSFVSDWQTILIGNGDGPCLAPPKGPSEGGTAEKTSTSGGGGGGAKSCPVQTSGNCAASRMTAFGTEADANKASQICYNESANGELRVSTVDLAQPSGRSVSFGLFQVNITAHKIGNLDCPAAFSCPDGTSPCPYTSKNHTMNITNSALYTQCKDAMLDDTQNIAYAASLYKQQGLAPWQADVNACTDL